MCLYMQTLWTALISVSATSRYDDFFGAQGKTGQKRKYKPLHGSDNIDMDRESSGESSDDEKNQVNNWMFSYQEKKARKNKKLLH